MYLLPSSCCTHASPRSLMVAAALTVELKSAATVMNSRGDISFFIVKMDTTKWIFDFCGWSGRGLTDLNWHTPMRRRRRRRKRRRRDGGGWWYISFSVPDSILMLPFSHPCSNTYAKGLLKENTRIWRGLYTNGKCLGALPCMHSGLEMRRDTYERRIVVGLLKHTHLQKQPPSNYLQKHGVSCGTGRILTDQTFLYVCI